MHEQVSPPVQTHPDQTDGTWMFCEHGGLWFAGKQRMLQETAGHSWDGK